MTKDSDRKQKPNLAEAIIMASILIILIATLVSYAIRTRTIPPQIFPIASILVGSYIGNRLTSRTGKRAIGWPVGVFAFLVCIALSAFLTELPRTHPQDTPAAKWQSIKTVLAALCFMSGLALFGYGVMTEYRQSRDQGPVAITPTLPFAIQTGMMVVLGMVFMPGTLPLWSYPAAFIASVTIFGYAISRAGKKCCSTGDNP